MSIQHNSNEPARCSLVGAAAARPSAATALAALLRGCRRERQRTEIYCRLVRELAWGRSCWARQAYIQLVAASLQVFSGKWVREYLLEQVVPLLYDAVPAVRLAALSLLPALKRTVRLPEDVERLVSWTVAPCVTAWRLAYRGKQGTC